MVLGRYHGGTPDTPWWRVAALSGGQFVEQACHIVDLARMLVGEAELIGACASPAPLPDWPDADVAGASAALVTFRSGAPGLFSATCLLPGQGGADLRLICDHAELVLEQTGFSYRRGHETQSVAVAEDPYVAQDRAFFAAVRAGQGRLGCSYAEGVGTLQLCLAIRDACSRG
jgi:predicted dehydrogenase